MSIARFRKALDERIVERANGVAETLCAGHVKDMETYSRLVGQIQALREVESWMDAVEREALGLSEEQTRP